MRMRVSSSRSTRWQPPDGTERSRLGAAVPIAGWSVSQTQLTHGASAGQGGRRRCMGGKLSAAASGKTASRPALLRAEVGK